MTRDRQKTDIEGTRRTRNHRPTRKRETRCYGHKGKKMQNKEKWNACKDISINREVSRHLLRKVSRKTTLTNEAVKEQSKDIRREARLIYQVSRSYWGGRRFLDRSTRHRGASEIAISKGLGSSIDSKVSRRCQASFSKQFFERRKTQTWMQSNI